MFRKVVTGLLMAVTAFAVSSAALAPDHDVRALPICAQETVNGTVVFNAGPFCVPYPSGVHCQETLAGMPGVLDTRTYVCVPRP